MPADAAGHDAGEMAEVRVDIERYAVKGDPVPDPHADRSDLVLSSQSAIDPNPDPTFAPLTLDPELRQRADHPIFQIAHIAANVAAALAEIEHDIGHTLARPMIGVFAAASGL